MAITHQASTGTPAGSAQGTTSVSVNYVGTPAAGQLAVLIVEVKPETATFNTPTDTAGNTWTLRKERTGGTGTFATDTGPTRVGIWTTEMDGTETTADTVTVGVTGGDATNGCMAGAMSTYAKTLTSWDVATATDGDDAGHDTSHSATAGAWPAALAGGDVVYVAHALDTDTSLGSTAPALSQSGATFGSATLRNASRSGSGFDGAVMGWDVPVTSGNANAPTFSFSSGSSECGPYALLRIRETSGGGAVSLAGIASAAALAGASLTVTSAAAPPVAAGLQAVFNGTDLPLVTVLAGWGGSGDPGSGYLHLGVGPGLGTGMLGGPTYVNVSADVRSLRWNRGRATPLEAATPGSLTVVLDNTSGAYDPSNASNPFGLTEANVLGVPVIVRAEFPLGTIYDRFVGEITDVEPDWGEEPTITLTVGDALERLGRTFLAAVDPSFDLDLTGERIGHLADEAGHPSVLRALDAGYTPLGPTTLGEHALPMMVKVERTEFGLLWVDGSGILTFYDRHRASSATRSTVVQATLTDAGTASGIEYDSVTGGLSRAGVVTEAHVLRDPLPVLADVVTSETSPDVPIEQVYADSTVAETLRGLSFPDDIGKVHRDDAQAKAMAQYLVDRFKVPEMVVREVVVDAIAQDRWAQLLSLRLLDRVSVRRDYGPAVLDRQRLIQGMTEEITDAPSWKMTFATSATVPAPSLFVLGTSALGVQGLGW